MAKHEFFSVNIIKKPNKHWTKQKQWVVDDDPVLIGEDVCPICGDYLIENPNTGDIECHCI